MQGAYVRHLSLESEPGDFDGTTRVLDELLANPGVREWLEANDPDWRPEFQQLVDSRIEVIRKKGPQQPEIDE